MCENWNIRQNYSELSGESQVSSKTASKEKTDVCNSEEKLGLGLGEVNLIVLCGNGNKRRRVLFRIIWDILSKPKDNNKNIKRNGGFLTFRTE